MTEAMQSADTFPKLLLEHDRLRGDRPAMREKDFGIWQPWSWSHVALGVRALACGLASIGFKRGQKLAILGDNRVRLYQGMAAAHALGGIAVPVYQDAGPDEILYVFNNAGVHVALVADQEQVDKLLEIKERCSSLETIIFIDPRGMAQYPEPYLFGYAEIKGCGRVFDEQHPGFYLQEVAQGKGEDIAMILHTSGATGKPKGAILSHNNLIITARNAAEIEGLSPGEEVLAYLPMAGSGDIMVSYAQSFVAGYCVSCPESADTILTDLREIGPSYFYGPPRVYESLMKSVMLRMESAGRLRRGLFNFFMKLGRRVGERILDREPVALSDRLLYGIGRIVIFNPLMDNLGLSRVRVATTGGDAIGPDVVSFFRALGMNLKQIYGQMEVSMFVTMQRNGQIKANTVGTPAKDVEIKIADTGEVLYRGPGAFAGYCNDPEATAAAKDAKGWVHTGDIGFFDGDGHLCIIDRVSDLDRLNDGTLVAPKYIENKLRFSPYIKTAVAFGNRRDCVAVFINIDPLAVGAWAQQRNLWYSGYADLAGKTEVCNLIAECVAKVNAELAAEARLGNPHIRHFMILDKELNADDGELTRTRKIRRHFIAHKYQRQIEALYAGQKGGEGNSRVTQGVREEGDAGGGPNAHQKPTFDSAPTEAVG
ncbi:long-chain acyl-CoA synthetase [AMP-forming] [Desulfuromonas soudanensis]|uniref:Long-chain acyl-CoA synthetase [AMP-forming] n=1 Tax=Desulfuromonas soudanensis TaxID=1603606 RepID=A0A0M3QEY3_9BACT|nr:AMP-binding protein [Desulfuromonas soudanensis]ALC15113.1 long-chain acyl-CoA synthetase [AMP-forming] [Desulfuromonas soudanensis]